VISGDSRGIVKMIVGDLGRIMHICGNPLFYLLLCLHV